MPTATRPGAHRSDATAIDRLRAAKQAAETKPDPAGTTAGVRPPGPPVRPTRSRLAVAEAGATAADPAEAGVAVAGLAKPAQAVTSATPPRRNDIPETAHVSPRARRESIVRTLSGMSRLRATIAAAMMVVLLAGLGVVATGAGRGALAAGTTTTVAAKSETTGITSLVNPAGVLSAPAAERLVDGSAIEPIDSTPYKITLGGVARYFRIHFPNDVAPRSARPLILVLPGWRRTARDAEREYGFDTLSDSADVTVAYLDGAHNSWDAGTCCGYAADEKLDDVGALHVIVDAMANLVRIDRSHVVLAGFSNGAMLAYRTACSQSSQLAGIIVASGSLQVGNCKPGALSLVVSHGARDTTLPIKGETYSSYLKGPVTSMAASLAPFEKADACASSQQVTTGRYAVTRLTRCKTGATVTNYVDGLGGHAWLGQVPVSGVVGGQSFAATAWQLLAGRTSATPFSP